MAPNSGNEDWRSIAEQATTELDPVRLMALIAQLCAAIDGGGTTQMQRPNQIAFVRDAASESEHPPCPATA